MSRVFVYGSLLRGQPNHRVLEGAHFLGPARTAPEFTLYDLTFYPGLVRTGAHSVRGELYDVDADTLARLDRLEGHPSYYRREPIALDDGSTSEAYLLTPDQVEGRPVIPSAQWRGPRKAPR